MAYTYGNNNKPYTPNQNGTDKGSLALYIWGIIFFVGFITIIWYNITKSDSYVPPATAAQPRYEEIREVIPRDPYVLSHRIPTSNDLLRSMQQIDQMNKK